MAGHPNVKFRYSQEEWDILNAAAAHRFGKPMAIGDQNKCAFRRLLNNELHRLTENRGGIPDKKHVEMVIKTSNAFALPDQPMPLIEALCRRWNISTAKAIERHIIAPLFNDFFNQNGFYTRER